MHDTSFEDVLRQMLRDEASTLPLTISTDVLERRLTERGARARARSVRVLLVAAAAVIALAGTAAFVGSQLTKVEPVLPDATVTLPATADMLTEFADATLRLERSVGPADSPVDPHSSAAPDASPTPVEVGRMQLKGPFVISVACLGNGEIRVEVRTPMFDFPYTQAIAPCDGKPVSSEYLEAPIDPESEGDVVSVLVDPGASWRVAVGEFPSEIATAPDFGPIELTEGWELVSNAAPVLLSAQSLKTGAHATIPDDATRAGVFVQCQGPGSITVSAGTSTPTEVACDPPGASRRIEYPVVGGEAVAVAVVGDGSRTWVRLLLEANAGIAATYPSAPPLPAGVADVPYTAPDNNVLAFGTIGSNRQTILSMQGTQPGMAAGDLLPVVVFNQGDDPHVDLALVSVSSGEVVRDLATIAAPSIIFDSWADATHDAVFYGVGRESGIEFHRVAVDGSADRTVATVESDPTGFTAELALDDSVFVVESCHAGVGCVRTVVDAATGESERTERTGDPICKIFGIVDGTIVGSTRPDCTEDAPSAVVTVPVGGGAPTTLLADVPRTSREGAFVVDTEDGPRFVLGGPTGPDDMPWDVLDMTSGETTTLPTDPSSVFRRGALDVRMPGGWILLAGGAMGDFPWQRAIGRPVPLLVNVVTGESVELVNLPHWKGNFPLEP